MTTIKMRRGTASEWTSANPVLADGEIGFERNTNKFKIGNGSTAWSSLPYFVDVATAIPDTLVDAKGDLIVGTAADTVTRLPVGGTNGHVLMVDSAQGSGIKWAAAPGGSGHSIEDEGTPLTARSKLNFVGSGVAVTDDSGDDATVVTIGSASGIPATIVDAKGDIIVATAADTVARLAVGGTNGHVLTVDSAQSSGIKWAAAPGGIETLPATIIDAKGDLIVGSAADTAVRIPVGGTNGHVLTVDSAQVSGIKWAAAPSNEYGEHLVTRSGSSWIYKGATIVARPTIPTYAQGARVVWDTSIDDTVNAVPSLAITGDIWRPHPDVAVALLGG